MNWPPQTIRPKTVGLAVVTALALGAGLFAASPANARVFVGFGIGLPAPVYYPPPVVYAPPPVAYVAPPPAAPAAIAPTAAGGQCREYQTQMMIDGRPQPSHGTACLQPDGIWRIVN